MTHDDESGPLDPAAALRLIDQQTAEVGTRANNTQATLFAVWGLAYLVGFGALALDPSATTAYSWRIVVFSCAMFAGIAASFGLGARFGSGVRGPARRAGIMIGLTWLLVFVSSGFISQAIFQTDIAPAKGFMLVAGISVLLVGALYSAFGAMSNDVSFFLLGVWFLVVDAIAMLVGTPTYLTIMALLGGGGFLVGAVITKFTRSMTSRRSGH